MQKRYTGKSKVSCCIANRSHNIEKHKKRPKKAIAHLRLVPGVLPSAVADRLSVLPSPLHHRDDVPGPQAQLREVPHPLGLQGLGVRVRRGLEAAAHNLPRHHEAVPRSPWKIFFKNINSKSSWEIKVICKYFCKKIARMVGSDIRRFAGGPGPLGRKKFLKMRIQNRVGK